MNLKILPILGRREEKETIELMKQHVEQIEATNKAFKETANATFNKKFDVVKQKANEVSECERKADRIKERVEVVLYKGAFLPVMRQNLFDLLDMMDNVPDSIQNAANVFIYLQGRKIPKRSLDSLKEMVTTTDKAIAKFSETFHHLIDDSGDLTLDVKDMKRIEENADELQHRIFDNLLIENRKLDPVTVQTIGTLSHFISQISDMALKSCNRMSLIKILRQA